MKKGVKSVVKEARRLASKQQENGQRPTLVQIADKMSMPPQRLRDYLRLARAAGATISMESTVEILNPVDPSPAYRDQDEWELRQGMLLDNGHIVRKDELVDEYLDEAIQREGDDEAWVQEEQTAGPLQDLIPDTNEPTPDDIMLEEWIKNNLSKFVDSTLEPQEIKVVRLYFGLDTGKSLSVEETANELGKSTEEISKLLSDSLEKLRDVYAAKYSGLLDEDDDFVEESV